MKFGAVIICDVTLKWQEKYFEIAAIGMMTSLIMLIYFNNSAKNG